jgi:hypothetical protein
METFDFIAHDEFRASLEADFQELRKCNEGSAWKAVLVLAGSVIETILVDSLIELGYKKREPLKMELADLVEACRSEGLISQRTSDLCSAVRSYRNLIHPGRSVRLKEVADENAAHIATALIPMIAREVAAKRESTHGLTAIQILSKVEHDPSALAILRHLLAELSDRERERLLLKGIPQRAAELQSQWDAQDLDDGDYKTYAALDRLRRCYRQALNGTNEELRRKAAAEYVNVIKGGTHAQVAVYDLLFRCSDMPYLEKRHVGMVKEHVLDMMKTDLSSETLELVAGLERYLETPDVPKWLNPFVRRFERDDLSDSLKDTLANTVSDAYPRMQDSVQHKTREGLANWREFYEKRNALAAVKRVEQLDSMLQDDLPF